MLKIQSNTFWIFGGTITFIVIFLFAVVKIYDITLNETKNSHQLQQMEMAKAATIGISTYLDHIVEDMHLFTFIPELQYRERNVIQSYVDYIFKHYDQEAVKAIFVTDLEAKIIYSIGDSLPDWVPMVIKEQMELEIKSTSIHSCWYSPVLSNFEGIIESGMSFLMIIPLTQNEQTGNRTGSIANNVGFVGYLLDFELLIQQFIAPLKLSKSDFAWIIDGNGRLIYHPEHTEMLLHSTKNLTSDCFECHSSFEMQNRMLIEEASTGEYTVADEPTKIMAYIPIQLQNEKWVLVISTFLSDVTANLREKFQLFFILGFIILSAILSFGLSLYYVNAKRIRAEEAKRQSEQMQELQQQLNQASKLASIGELVDTVAHEINTPTGIIAAQADAVLLQDKPTDKNSEELHIIKQQTKRISKYTRTLLDYSKRVHFNPKPTSLSELLDECVYMLGHRFNAKKVTVKNNYPATLPKVLLDRGQMEQVFINLLNNAVDALNSPGVIKINAKIIRKGSTFEDNKTIEGIMIDITDNGEGIKEADINQIFEPFFSTKLPTEGTGLGLYITKSIIQRHHGKIEVTSTVDKGTTFKIFLLLNFKGN
jgi:signal transduction histidine kinase